VHTSSHVSALLRLAQLAALYGDGRSPAWTQQLDQLPAVIEQAVGLRSQVAGALDLLRLDQTIHFIGGGPARATALEGALKVREAAYVAAEGHELESVLHGPLTSFQPDQSAVVIAQPGASLERAREVAAALADIGVATIAVGPAAGSLPAAARIETPLLDELLAPIVNVIPLQWLAYEASRRRQVDADSFRRDVPAYAAAQKRFAL
jgi:glucosamine--fructose-6-phosphate aminotransferase (isomerizing)